MHAVAQQTPCAQMPELHSVAAPHAVPFGFLPQLMLAQLFGETHSALVEQVVPHLPSVPHMNGSHPDEVAARHTPAPSHVRGEVSVEPVQLAAPQTVPATCCRQAPAPLQVPSFPQVVAAAATHWVARVGGWPAGMGEQAPGEPVRLQATHAAAQPVLQQVPCSQYPEAHSSASVHAPPFGFLAQIVAMQT